MELGIAVYAEPAATLGALSFVESQKLLPSMLASSGMGIPFCALYAKEHKIGFAAAWPTRDKLYIYSTFSGKIGFDSYLILAGREMPSKLIRKLPKLKEPPLHKRLEQLILLESLLKRAGCTHVLSIFTYVPKDGAIPRMPARRVGIPLGEGTEEERREAAFWHLRRSRSDWLPSLLYMDEDRWKKIYVNKVEIKLLKK
ncbi:MAG TPA: hypothetical protein GX701_03900 [Clostridiales bacterium]|jgi:hypothetical protein|nr:hypothetical protein [Clostridiales bacterium]